MIKEWLRRKFEKSDYRLVKTIDYGYQVVFGPGSPEYYRFDDHKRKETLTYYLYEDQHCNRRIDVIDTDPNRGDLTISQLEKDDWVFRNVRYRTTIRPWLDGAYDPEIPTYDTIKHKDMLSSLKGKKVL